MGLLAPLSLAFAALSIPIAILYMLKLRREEKIVSSTFLWQQVLQDREANAPWQKLRRNLLLLLQLLLLLLLVLSLARPYRETSQVFQGHIIVLLDASASMQATDVGELGASPNRFEMARARARQAIDGLGANDSMTLIAVAGAPRVLASLTNDKSVLRQALDQAQVSNAEADWEAAFILAASSMQQATRNSTLILSDGGLPARLPPVPGSVRYVPTGVSAENLAIAALAVRDGAHGPQAFVRIANPGTRRAAPLVEIYITTATSGGEILFDARTLDIDPGDEQGIAIDDLPLDTQQIRARLPKDALDIDNTAWAVRAPDKQAAVLLATPGNTFLERAIGLMPRLNAITLKITETLTHAQISQPTLPPALYILDGIAPAEIPPTGNLLFIAPPASTELFRVSGVLTGTDILHINHDHALLRYVDFSKIHVARAQNIDAPWAQVLVKAQGGPLLLAGEAGGRRIAILTFDLHHSDLPLQIAFPILIANLANWLAPTSAVDVPDQLAPGMPALIHPQMGVDQIVVTAPGGQRWVFAVEDNKPVPFAQTQKPGIYRVEQKRGDETLNAAFAVNLFSELESRIAPQDRIEVGEEPVTAQPHAAAGRREWWRWPALAALGILLIEWMVHYRGRLPFSLHEIILSRFHIARREKTASE